MVEDRNEKQEEEEESQNQKRNGEGGVIGKYSDVTNRDRKAFVWEQRMSQQDLGFLSSSQL